MSNFFITTLGCKINQYETQAIREAWRRAGYVEVDEAGVADVVIVNTCAVTARAVRDVRNTVRRAHRENPEARILVTGCAAQALPKELAQLPGVQCADDVIPQSEKERLLTPPKAQTPSEGEHFPPFRIEDFSRARAVLKVQDGCVQHCSYCIVPLTRGPSVSRPALETLAEARRLLGAGVRELVLSGINLGQYEHAQDLGGGDFWDLLSWLDGELAPEWSGRARLRISSLDPGQLNEKGLEAIRNSRLLCPHLHLSLQSGSPDVLRRMRRAHYAPEAIVDFTLALQKTFPLLALGADLLTGFPGEEEQHFQETLAMCRELPLTYAHVFPYSKRPGTAAARFSNQVDKAEKKRRAAALRGLAEEKKQDFLHRVARVESLTVAVENNDPGQGVSEHYVECRFETPPLGLRPKSLAVCAPLRVEGARLLVAPVSDGGDKS